MQSILAKNGGTLTTRSLFATQGQFTGSGTINTRGLVSDVDLVFDATHGMVQSLTWLGGQQNISVSLDLSAAGAGPADLGVGYFGLGSLAVRGVTVTTTAGYLGYKAGSQGTALTEGTSSLWSTGIFYAGYSGTGSLTVSQGRS